MKYLTLIICALLSYSLGAQEHKLENLEGIDSTSMSNAVEQMNIALGNENSSSAVLVSNEPTLDIAEALENSQTFNEFRQSLATLQDEKEIKYTRELNAFQIQFATAVDLTFKIISDVKKLEVLYGSLEIYSDFADNANPTNYSAFNSNLENLKQGKFKSGIELPDVEISNPYISIAYSLIGGIFSKNSDRAEAINNMTCVIEYTMDFKSDLRSINTSISYLSESSTTNKENGIKLFNKLVKQIGYDGDYYSYMNALHVSSYPLGTFKHSFFEEFIDGSSSNYNLDRNVRIRELKLIIQSLGEYIDSYEALLYNGLSYYESFLKIVNKYLDENVDFPCIEEEDRGNFQEMHDDLEDIRNQYKEAYTSVVTTADMVSLIFGIRSQR